MLKKIKNIISVCFTLIKFALIKSIRFCEFEFKPIERFSPATMINIWRGGKLVLGEKVRAHSGTRLSVTPNGLLKIGNNTTFNYNCIVVAKERIEIGNGVEFGPNVFIYDHDHDFRAPGGLKAGKYISEPVVIGDNTWIGAGTIILRGTILGDNCVVGAGCVLKGNYPANSIIVQKRDTEIRNNSRSIIA